MKKQMRQDMKKCMNFNVILNEYIKRADSLPKAQTEGWGQV